MASNPNASTIPPIKLGGSKWRPFGATVVLDGTSVVDETLVDSGLELVVELGVVELDVEVETEELVVEKTTAPFKKYTIL